MVFNATFSNISVKSWQSVLLMECPDISTNLSQVTDKLYRIKIHLSIHSLFINTKLLLVPRGPSWSWSYGNWIYSYLWNRCLPPLKLWCWNPVHGKLCSIQYLCDEVCQWLVASPWLSLVSSINKADHHDITEILFKVVLSTINQPLLFPL